MRRYFIKVIGMAACVSFFGSQAMSQEATGKDKLGENDEIIIRRKGDKDSKVTVEINNGEVKVNGKLLSEYNDDNVTVRRRGADAYGRAFVAPRSPFQGSTWNFNDNEAARGMRINSNKAVLGVVTEKDDKGAKINNITKGSAAEKAGLKEGDVITKVDDTKIENPEDLSKTIGKYKPEDKATVTYMRDKKEQKANVTLNKRIGATMYPGKFDFNNDFNFDFNSPDGLTMIRGGSPKLGIKAQDTEDGKGVKVLDVDDESNAQKAGIKEGDILTEFDGKSVNSATELMDAAKGAKDKNTIKIKLTRNGKSQEVEIKIPKKLKTANL